MATLALGLGQHVAKSLAQAVKHAWVGFTVGTFHVRIIRNLAVRFVAIRADRHQVDIHMDRFYDSIRWSVPPGWAAPFLYGDRLSGS